MTSPQGTLELHELVLPTLTNHHGTLFAGQGLQLMAKAAFLAARGLAGKEVVMAGVRSIDFLAPIHLGQQLVLRASVSRIGRSSMTVCVSGQSLAPGMPDGKVLEGMFEMVAVDDQGRPTPIQANPTAEEISQ